jgi:hypothetical protein
MEHPIFRKILPLQIMVCCQCKHGVYLTEADAHLRGKHFMKLQECQPIINMVLAWHDIIQNPTDVQILSQLDDPLPVLDVHTNGMQC